MQASSTPGTPPSGETASCTSPRCERRAAKGCQSTGAWLLATRPFPWLELAASPGLSQKLRPSTAFHAKPLTTRRLASCILRLHACSGGTVNAPTSHTVPRSWCGLCGRLLTTHSVAYHSQKTPVSCCGLGDGIAHCCQGDSLPKQHQDSACTLLYCFWLGKGCLKTLAITLDVQTAHRVCL